MNNSALYLLLVGVFLVGVVAGWFTRGVFDPRYQYELADTTRIRVVVDSAAVRTAAELRVIVARMTAEGDSLRVRALRTDALFGVALSRLARTKEVIDSLRAALDSGAVYDVVVAGDTTFLTKAKAVTDSGDVLDVAVTAEVGMQYSFLTNELSAGIELSPIYVPVPVRRTHEVKFVRENFLLWVEPTVAMQSGQVGGGGQLGIRNYGVGVLAIPEQPPVFMLSGRWGI